MIRKSLVAVAAAVAIVATASPASARWVPDEPDSDTTYCGPGYDFVRGSCVPHPRLDLNDDSLGEWVLAGFGIVALVALV
jgi:hypothetical protein